MTKFEDGGEVVIWNMEDVNEKGSCGNQVTLWGVQDFSLLKAG
jgi:hypothetical protein